eukprot:evm.model.NODE_17916_length_6768_cov_23.135048.1
MLEMHLDNQADAKALLGAVVCGETPGEFLWRAGPLTLAVERGQWVCIEDVDRAPVEVLAALTPLLETGQLTLPGRATPIQAHANFRLFGTVTTSVSSSLKPLLGGLAALAGPWVYVRVKGLEEKEVSEVVRGVCPGLPSQVHSLLLQTFAALPPQIRRRRVSPLRDMIKVGRRLASSTSSLSLSPSSLPMTETGGKEDEEGEAYITEAQRLEVLSHLLDVVGGGEGGMEGGEGSMAYGLLTRLWNVRVERLEEVCLRHRPTLGHVAVTVNQGGRKGVEGGKGGEGMQRVVLRIGRAALPCLHLKNLGLGGRKYDLDDSGKSSSTSSSSNNPSSLSFSSSSSSSSSSFVWTNHALRALERVAVAAGASEPVLLIGETGCGKTTMIQALARETGQTLIVQNLSLQSDGADLVGGYRPVELAQAARRLYNDMLPAFEALFSRKKNARFLDALAMAVQGHKWKRLADGMKRALASAEEKLTKEEEEGEGEREGGEEGESLRARWANLAVAVHRFDRRVLASSSSSSSSMVMSFEFVEGLLVKAVREGHWVLLDEINLASAEVLQRLTPLLDHEGGREGGTVGVGGGGGSLVLTEKGDVAPVPRHPNFRLFAAMNPANDAGKKELPPSLRARFTEVE